ncbi:hypothetical protein ACWEO2_43295 [Nocardia sp. NPDC004278]
MNPWQEVITYVTVGSAGLLAGSVIRGLSYVPALLDLGLRISNLGLERRIERAEMRNRLQELDDEFLNRLVRTTSPTEQQLLDALIEIGPSAAEVTTRPVDHEEVQEMRERVLRGILDIRER